MDFAGHFMIWGALVGIIITLIGIERKLIRIAERTALMCPTNSMNSFQLWGNETIQKEVFKILTDRLKNDLS